MDAPCVHAPAEVGRVAAQQQLTLLGRLKPGATLEQAQSEIDALNARNMVRFPQFKEILTNAGFRTAAVPFQEELVRDIRATLYLLWGGVLFVVLIGCVNVANLVLVRSNVRLKEMATRHALGAGRGRIARQLVTESVLLAAVGGGLGLLLGSWSLNVLGTLGVQDIPRGSEIGMSSTVVLFVAALAVIVGALIAVLPVASVARINLNTAMREEGRTGTSGRGARLIRRTLVTAQVAFAFVLLIGSGLLLASFRELLAVKPGFISDHVLTAMASPPASRYQDDASLRSFTLRSLERIRAVPGIISAGVSSSVPMAGDYSDSVIVAEGYVMKPGESLISPSQIQASDGYFESMGIALVRGRFFRASDTERSPKVVVVDERLAKKFWPNQDPIGRRMYQPNNPEEVAHPTASQQWMTVVGVVATVRERGLTGTEDRIGAYYLPVTQNQIRTHIFVMKTAGDPHAVVGTVRTAVASIDPELPLFSVRTLDERMRASLVSRRAAMVLALTFGVLALFLAAIGIYGMLAYQVAHRTREIGIRMALGSSAQRIFQLIVGEGVRMMAIGFAIGVAGAIAMGRAIQAQLYGVTPLDPVVLSLAAGLLGVVAMIATVLPARRATRINPVIALTEQ